MELTGKVVLDKESEKALREKIREEIIQDIAENGNYGDEIEKFLLKCGFKSYYIIIRDTINKVLGDVNEDKEIHFQNERDVFKKLQTIQSIINL